MVSKTPNITNVPLFRASNDMKRTPMSHLPHPSSLGELRREYPPQAHLALMPPGRKYDEQRHISYPVTYPKGRWEVQNVPWTWVCIPSLPPHEKE